MKHEHRLFLPEVAALLQRFFVPRKKNVGPCFPSLPCWATLLLLSWVLSCYPPRLELTQFLQHFLLSCWEWICRGQNLSFLVESHCAARHTKHSEELEHGGKMCMPNNSIPVNSLSFWGALCKSMSSPAQKHRNDEVSSIDTKR